MKLFAMALAIVCGIAAALFVIGFALLSVFYEQPEALRAAGGLGGLPILTFPKLLEVLEQQKGRENLAAGKRSPIYDFSGFQIAWPLMALYGWLLLFAVDIVFVMLTTPAVMFLDDIKEPHRWAYELMLILSDVPVLLVFAYFVGRWIGTCCASRGVVAVLLAISLFSATNLAIDLVFPDEPGDPSSLRVDLSEFPFLVCLGLIGYWRGRNFRLSRYLHYLLSVLPADTRDLVIELAFGEAQERSSATRSAIVRK